MTSFRLCSSSVQTGDKVKLDSLSRSTLSPKLNTFNSVDFVESGWFLSPECRTSFRHSVDRFEFDKIDRVEFDLLPLCTVISNSRTLTGCFWWYSVKWLKPKSEWIHYILGTVRRMHGSIKIRKSGFESPITLGSDYQRSRARCTRRWRRYALKLSKKLSCHRETARCFMS